MNHNANLQSRDIDHEVRGVCVPEVSQIPGGCEKVGRKTVGRGDGMPIRATNRIDREDPTEEKKEKEEKEEEKRRSSELRTCMPDGCAGLYA